MVDVVIYTKNTCGFCHRAKALLDRKNISYHEIDIGQFPEKREEMINKSNRTTVPQIFIGEAHIGGHDDLFEASLNGELDSYFRD